MERQGPGLRRAGRTGFHAIALDAGLRDAGKAADLAPGVSTQDVEGRGSVSVGLKVRTWTVGAANTSFILESTKAGEWGLCWLIWVPFRLSPPLSRLLSFEREGSGAR